MASLSYNYKSNRRSMDMFVACSKVLSVAATTRTHLSSTASVRRPKRPSDFAPSELTEWFDEAASEIFARSASHKSNGCIRRWETKEMEAKFTYSPVSSNELGGNNDA